MILMKSLTSSNSILLAFPPYLTKKLSNINIPNFSFVTNQCINPLVVKPFYVYSVLSNLNIAKCKDFKNLPNRLL